jgi:hypothetical protein
MDCELELLVSISGTVKISVIFTDSTPTWKHTHWVLQAHSWEERRLKREADNSPAFSAEVKNVDNTPPPFKA